MKDYKSYMDRVNVSEEMHEKLLNPERPVKKPVRWQKYAAAACAVLLVGVGAFGLRTGQTPPDPGPVQCAAPSAPMESSAAIEIAPVEGDDIEPGMRTIEGYETRETRAGVDVNVYHILPWIDYGSANNAATGSLDWDIPTGGNRRNLTDVEIVRLLGGQDAVDLHLDWSAYELSGWWAWYEDGSFWGAYLQGCKGPMDHFEFVVTSGIMPPTDTAFGDSVEQEVWGMSVTADKYDGKDGCARRVSFMKDDYGYRFDLTATGDPEDAEKLVSRAVTWIANGDGLDFASISPNAVVTQAPEANPTAILPLEDGEGASAPSQEPSTPPSQDGASSQDSTSSQAPSMPPATANPN